MAKKTNKNITVAKIGKASQVTLGFVRKDKYEGVRPNENWLG